MRLRLRQTSFDLWSAKLAFCNQPGGTLLFDSAFFLKPLYDILINKSKKSTKKKSSRTSLELQHVANLTDVTTMLQCQQSDHSAQVRHPDNNRMTYRWLINANPRHLGPRSAKRPEACVVCIYITQVSQTFSVACPAPTQRLVFLANPRCHFLSLKRQTSTMVISTMPPSTLSKSMGTG